MVRSILMTCLLAAALAAVPCAASPSTGREKKLDVLVVAGGHGYPVAPFRAVFDFFADMRCTFIDEKETAEAFDDPSTLRVDAIVLYNYMRTPTPGQQESILKATRKGVGLVILHHAIYGYRPWPEFMNLVGVTTWLTGTKDDVAMRIRVADPKHPITAGLKDFDIVDETYAGSQLAPGMRVLLETDEPLNMRHVAWVHRYNRSPVCYLQLGHGEQAYQNRSFIEVLGRAIRWAAGPPRPDRRASMVEDWPF